MVNLVLKDMDIVHYRRRGYASVTLWNGLQKPEGVLPVGLVLTLDLSDLCRDVSYQRRAGHDGPVDETYELPGASPVGIAWINKRNPRRLGFAMGTMAVVKGQNRNGRGLPSHVLDWSTRVTPISPDATYIDVVVNQQTDKIPPAYIIEAR